MTKQKLPAKPNTTARNVVNLPPNTSSLGEISGSSSHDFTSVLINQMLDSQWRVNSDTEGQQMMVSAAMVAMKGIKPQDELEGMMAAQLLACHNASMECFRRAMLKEQGFDIRMENLSQANKLTRSFATLISALGNYRGKGVTEQKVTVQHVHVSDGGQAIVGNVAKT